MRRAVEAIKFLGLIAVALYLAHAFTAGHDNITRIDHGPSHAELLVEIHDNECWQLGDEPLAELPGAAIVSLPDGHAIYTQNPDHVTLAFDEVLATIGYGDAMTDLLDPIALCL